MSTEITAGRHRGHVTSAALGLTESGKDQIAITFRFPECEDRSMTWYGYFTDGAFETTSKALKALGYDLEASGFDVDPLEGEGANTAIYNAEASLVVEMEEAQGEFSARLRIRWVNSVGGVKNPLDEAARRGLSAGLRARFGSGGGSKPVRPQSPPAADIPEDDVPF